MDQAPATDKRDGFRERGQQVTRVEAFVDAAFAFAVTLLVISFDGLPKSAHELVAAYKGIPAFAASFLLLATFWRAHERWSRWYGLDDSRSTALSLILVLVTNLGKVSTVNEFEDTDAALQRGDSVVSVSAAV